MVEREKEVWMVKVWSHGCEVSEYEVEDRQCLYSPGFYHAGTSASPVAVLVAQSLRVAVQDGASSLGGLLLSITLPDVIPSKAPLLKYGWKCSGVEGSGSGVEGSEASTSESKGSRVI